jgi:catechol O-methyltransferase
VLQAIDDYSRATNTLLINFKLPKIDASRAVLSRLAPPPKTLVELGTYVGGSAVGWGSIMRDVNGGRAEGVRVLCCEFDDEFVSIAGDHVKLAGVDDVVRIVPGKSSESLRRMKEDGTLDKIDVLFLDHFKGYYLPDLKLCEDLGLFHEGTIILADNMDPRPELPEYVQYVRGGGRGGDGTVKYESYSVATSDNPDRPNVVEVTTVVKVPAKL